MDPRVAIVGGIAVERDGRRVDSGVLAARRSRLILAALSAQPGGLTPRALAEIIWDDPPPTWKSARRSAVAALRASLEAIDLGGQRVIVSTATGYALADGIRTDVEEGEVTVELAEKEFAAERATAALGLLATVAAVLRGKVLPDDEADWIDELRSRHLRLVTRAGVLEAEASLRAGLAAASVAAAEQLIAREPIDERAHRLLIRALAASGDRAGAIRAFERCRVILADELGVDPGAETTAAYLEVLRSGSSGMGSLPEPPRNGFFGRHEELTHIVDALQSPGVVSVVGRGGVGKSRLALHAAHAAAGLIGGGRFWAPLGDLVEPGLVSVTIATAVGAPAGPDPLSAVIERLAPAGDTLLVLDGCEQVLDAVSEVVVALRESIPGLRILATSRWPLDLGEERRIEVEPLPVPDALDQDFARSAVVALIADRVAARQSRLRLDERNVEALRVLCQRCGGIPLALELAAAQLASMAVGDLLDILPTASDHAVDVLEALLSQSYAALGDEEAAAFRAWGAVDGVLPLPLVRAMVIHAVPAARVARRLSGLADAGLVVVDRSGPRWKYRMDDQIRAFARARLLEDGEETEALEGLASELLTILPPDPRQPPAPFAEAIADAADGLRTVLTATVDGRLPRQRGLELAFRLHRSWAATGLAEGRYWLGRLLDGADDDSDDAGEWTPFATFAAGYLAYWAEGGEDARALLENAAEQLDGIDDGFSARALVFAGGLADDYDQPDDALRDVREAIERAERADDPNLMVTASMGLGSILAERGDPSAVEFAERALALCTERGSADQLLATLATAAMVAWQVGDLPTSRRWIDQAADVLSGPPRIARVVLAIAASGCSLAENDLDRAADFAAVAVTDARELGVDRELPLALALTARVELARRRQPSARAAAIELLDVVGRLGYLSPTAIALETAALVAEREGGETSAINPLLATSAAIRVKGARPAPTLIRIALPDSPKKGMAPSAQEAVIAARKLLLSLQAGSRPARGSRE